MWRLKETVHREAHNAGRDEEPRVRAAAQDGPQATDRAEDNANVVHQTATEAAQENKEKKIQLPIASNEGSISFVSSRFNLRVAHLSKYK